MRILAKADAAIITTAGSKEQCSIRCKSCMTSHLLIIQKISLLWHYVKGTLSQIPPGEKYLKSCGGDVTGQSEEASVSDKLFPLEPSIDMPLCRMACSLMKGMSMCPTYLSTLCMVAIQSHAGTLLSQSKNKSFASNPAAASLQWLRVSAVQRLPDHLIQAAHHVAHGGWHIHSILLMLEVAVVIFRKNDFLMLILHT